MIKFFSLENQLSNMKQNLTGNFIKSKLSSMRENLAENLAQLKENNKFLESRLQEHTIRIKNEIRDTVQHLQCELDRKLIILEKQLENQIVSRWICSRKIYQREGN